MNSKSSPLWSSGPASVLTFLRAHLRKAEPFKLLKMLVIGPPRQGKSALLEVLQTGRASPFTPSERSISTSTWELDKPNGGKNCVRKTNTAHASPLQWTHTHTHTHICHSMPNFSLLWWKPWSPKRGEIFWTKKLTDRQSDSLQVKINPVKAVFILESQVSAEA